MQEKVRIGFVVGNDTDRAIEFDQAVNVALRGNNDADLVLKLAFDEAEFDWTRLHMTPSYFRKTKRWDTSKVDVLWNMVSDADQNPKTLDAIERFTADFDIPVIDPPRQVRQTRRHQIALRLAGIDNVHMPKTLLLRNPTLERVKRQVEEVGFRFPAILRRTGSHNGEFIGLFATPEQIQGVYGDRGRDYYMTEFVDFRWPDGLYRKTRFFIVGGEVVIRQHVVSSAWNIHGRTAREMVNQPAHEAEGLALLTGGFPALPTITQTALSAISRSVGLDYFGIDANLDPQGRLVVFEANATMNFLPRNGQMRQRSLASVAPMVASVRRLLLNKVAQRATKT